MGNRTSLSTNQLAEAFAAYAESRSDADRNRIVEAHLGLVAYVARKLLAQAPPHVTRPELESWGALGLLEAVERFQPDRGLTFANFAVSRIRGAIIDEMRHEDWAPRQVRARARRWEDRHAELCVRLGRIPSAAEAASMLGGAPESPTVLFVGLDGPPQGGVGPDPDTIYMSGVPSGPPTEPGSRDASQDTASELEIAELRDRMAAAVGQLPDRMRIVMALHYREEMDLHQIAGLLDCGATLVSNIQTDALHLLRQLIGAA